jgi:hypothetical protein
MNALACPLKNRLVAQGAAGAGGGGGEGGQASSHIFQALQYLRKLANHPKLVFNAGSENHGKIAEELRRCSSAWLRAILSP